MIKLNKNKFAFLNNNLVLPSMIITLISFPFLSYAGGASMHSPIEQFVVKKIFEIQDPFFGYDISFTNASLFMVLASIVPLLILTMGVRYAEMIPGKLQSISEMLFEFVENLLIENTGNAGRPYFSFILEKSSKLTTTQAIIMFLPDARFDSSIAIFNW